MRVSEKITGNQLGFLIFTFVVSTLILSVPGVMVAFAKQDAWMSVFPASITGIISIWVMTTLANRYPGLTIMEYSTQIVGKWLGKIFGFYFSYYLFFFISSTVNEHAGFIRTVLLPRTPSFVGVVTILILAGLAVFSGIEVIGRCNEVLVPIIIILLIPLFILSIGDSDPGQLKPVLGEGIMPVLKGAVVPSAWMSQFFFLGWLLPYLNQPQKARKASMIALLCMVILIVVIDLVAIMVFGPISGRLNFSFLRVIEYIGIVGSLERMEALAISVWIMGIFVKVSVLLFMFCLSVSQLFDIKNYRGIVSPVTLLSIIGSVWIFKNAAEFQAWITHSYPILALFTQTLLPLSLLIIDTIRRSINKSLL